VRVAGSPRLEIARIVGAHDNRFAVEHWISTGSPAMTSQVFGRASDYAVTKTGGRERPDFDDYANGLRLPNRDTPHEEVTRVG
jgi:hypothetical protein